VCGSERYYFAFGNAKPMHGQVKGTNLSGPGESETTKPSERGFVGSEGFTSEVQCKKAIVSLDVTRIEPASDDPAATLWAEWKAAALNQLFREQGLAGQPGNITAATLGHGCRLSCGRRITS
jgi:hypothetical protein